MAMTGLYVRKIAENDLAKTNAAIKTREARSVSRKVVSSGGGVLYMEEARRMVTRHEIFEEEEERTKKMNAKERAAGLRRNGIGNSIVRLRKEP